MSEQTAKFITAEIDRLIGGDLAAWLTIVGCVVIVLLYAARQVEKGRQTWKKS